MSETKDIQDVYEIILDEIDFFMESIYKENILYEQIIEELKNDDTLPEDVKQIAESIKGADVVLSRLNNMKLLLKSIAFQNHSLELFDEDEKEDFFIKVLLGIDTEVV